jgi:hypothetical protein
MFARFIMNRIVDAFYLKAPSEQFRASLLYTMVPYETLSARYVRELSSVKVRFDLLK